MIGAQLSVRNSIILNKLQLSPQHFPGCTLTATGHLSKVAIKIKSIKCLYVCHFAGMSTLLTGGIGGSALSATWIREADATHQSFEIHGQYPWQQVCRHVGRAVFKVCVMRLFRKWQTPKEDRGAPSSFELSSSIWKIHEYIRTRLFPAASRSAVKSRMQSRHRLY